MSTIVKEVKGLYSIIKLKLFRQTPGVIFDLYPMETLSHISSIDRVLHEKSANSPGSVDNVDISWYMHPNQEDHLMVLFGERHVWLYNKDHGKVEEFIVRPNEIYHNGELVIKGGAVLTWPTNVFHRIKSGKNGSASLNLATHTEGFDIKTNFNIYDLNTKTGEYNLLRYGYEDQL